MSRAFAVGLVKIVEPSIGLWFTMTRTLMEPYLPTPAGQWKSARVTGPVNPEYVMDQVRILVVVS